ncbi:carboxypeptidase-like regulatory domain-containing protein [Algoriphagus boritolerans]|uniref:Carboxypeptidase regulatory-like domain-containing protein n=1 Tax=Algoriphagus boritolerans DSM 17298 = JCM 18970 TaxID=1120964 RepID=A0A1H5ZFV8_9BACT|nr:carboxypeptidase-like regulatory domain-containing protein [Algoriphagus boritolerans]SEG34934.1 Carboxypeptidase regulatory-like domain-containing protein [Algoriphagus boritolerans DSM 17298 = JCM 18970]
MRLKNFTYKICLYLVLLLSITLKQNAFSQAVNATVSGRLTDTSGEMLIGAQILIKNEQTGFTASTVTGGTGNYIVSQIPLGNDYTVTASYLGFGTKSITGLVLNQGNVNAVLNNF